MLKIDELRERIKEQPERWEQEIFQFACSLACKLAEQIFREMDYRLEAKEAVGMRAAGFREKRVISLRGRGESESGLPWAVSHTKVHNLSGKVADSYLEEEKEIKASYKHGCFLRLKGR